MPLTLVTGPANAAKAGAVLGPLRDRLAEDPVLVVPTLEDVEHSQRELAQRGAIFGATVVRLPALYELIAQRTGAARRTASKLQLRLIVERAVAAASLVEMAASAGRPGFAPAAGELFAELGRQLVTPARFTAALKQWGTEYGREAYARELGALYSRYHSELEHAGLVDEELFGREALDALKRDPTAWGVTPTFFYGFDDLDELGLDAVETLARHTDVVISIPWEPDREALRATDELRARLSGIAAEAVHLDAIDEHYAPGSRKALYALERGLFEAAVPDAIDPDAAIALHLSGGDRAEVELCGAEVLALLRSGTAPGDIAVVFNDPSRYASLVEQVFGAYGIPFSIDVSAPFQQTAIGAGLLALARSALGMGTAEDVLAWLRTPGVLKQPGLADRLEYEVRRSGARDAQEALTVWDTEVGKFPLDAVKRLAGASDRDFPGALRVELGRLLAAPYRGQAHLLAGAEAGDPRAFTAADAALAELDALAAAGVTATKERTLELLAELDTRVGERTQPDRVQVATPGAIRARRFEAVIVCGLQEGEFPRRPGGDPFLSDSERAALASASGLRLPLRAARLDRERYLFYVCASRAERRLVLSTRVSGEEGEPQARSPFVDDVVALFPAIDTEGLRRERTLGHVAWDVADAPTELEWERAVALRGPDIEVGEVGAITDPAALAALSARGPISAGALEAYSGCPVSWLVDKVLRPDELEPDPDAMVRGLYLHRVLERVYRRLLDEGHDRVTPDNLERAIDLLREALDTERGELRLAPDEGRLRAALHRLQFDLTRYLHEESKDTSSFDPTHLELDFGRGPEGPVEIAGVEVTGRIDRVDVRDGEAVVRDYKSGRGEPYAAARWEPDNLFQGALYMLAVRALLGLEPVGALFVGIKDGNTRGAVREDRADALGGAFKSNDRLSAEALAAVERWAERALADAAAGMREGRLESCPRTCAYDGGCKYPSICRAET